MNKVTLILSCGLFFSGMITGCGGDNQNSASTDNTVASDNRNSVSAENTVPSKKTLKTTTSGCQVKNISGVLVKFSNTSIPEGEDWSEQILCDIARDMVDKAYVSSKESLRSFCGTADEFVKKFGDGNYDLAIQKASSAEKTKGIQFTLNALQFCKTKQSRIDLVKKTAPLAHVYSVGQFTYKDKPCKGYMQSIAPSSDTNKFNNSLLYSLSGIGDCVEFTSDKFSNVMFSPEERPTAPPQGTYIRNNFHYTGVMPETYQYKGKWYPYTER